MRHGRLDGTIFKVENLNFQHGVSNGKSNLRYNRCITLKHVTSLRDPSPRHCAWKQHSSFPRNVGAVASRWQHCVQFDRLKI